MCIEPISNFTKPPGSNLWLLKFSTLCFKNMRHGVINCGGKCHFMVNILILLVYHVTAVRRTT